MVFGHFRYAWMARSNRFKLIERNEGKGPNELYDMRQDPREFKNLYGDPRFVSVQEELSAALKGWRQRSASA